MKGMREWHSKFEKETLILSDNKIIIAFKCNTYWNGG